MKRKWISLADLENGFLGGLIMAGPVFVINLTGGAMAAAMAGFVQFFYSFFVVFVNTNICRHLAPKHWFLAVSIPTFLTTLLTYLVHIYAGSPEPFFSALYAFFTAIIGLGILTWRFRISDKTWIGFIKELLKS